MASLLLLVLSTTSLFLSGTSFLNLVYRFQTKKEFPLVTFGVYRYVRNPRYLADFGTLLSIFLITGSYFNGITFVLCGVQSYFLVRLEEK